MDLEQIKKELKKISGVKDIHHLHVWCISEDSVSAECHIVADDTEIISKVTKLLDNKFGIGHCNIQIEKNCNDCEHCDL